MLVGFKQTKKNFIKYCIIVKADEGHLSRRKAYFSWSSIKHLIPPPLKEVGGVFAEQ
jgi:hypothetical protein